MDTRRRSVSEKRVSFIYAAEQTEAISPTLQSLLDQTYHNKEIVMVALGNKKVTIPELDPTVKTYTIKEKDRFSAFNEGMKQASGEYLIFLKEGDELQGMWVEKGMDLVMRMNKDAALCSTMYQQGDVIARIDTPINDGRWFKRLVMGPQFETHSVVVRKEICPPFPTKYPLLGDWAFWLTTLDGKKVELWPDHIGAIVQGDIKEIQAQRSRDSFIEQLQIMVEHRDRVKGVLQKRKHTKMMKKLYNEYCNEEIKECASLKEALFS